MSVNERHARLLLNVLLLWFVCVLPQRVAAQFVQQPSKLVDRYRRPVRSRGERIGFDDCGRVDPGLRGVWGDENWGGVTSNAVTQTISKAVGAVAGRAASHGREACSKVSCT